MLDVLLHAGTGHPNLAWIIVPSFLTFIAGLVIGHHAGQVRTWLTPADT